MQSKRRTVFILAFMLPTFFFYLLFFVYPIFQAFYVSLFRWTGLSRNRIFVGFENFRRLFSDPIILLALKHNIFVLLCATCATFIISIFFATILTRKKYAESGFYRIVFLFPNLLSIVVISIIWMFLYNPSFGIINQLLKAVHLDRFAYVWLGDEKTVLPALVVPVVWMQAGFYMLLYMSGMQNVPQSLYESATLDGASEFTQFIRITLPLIWEIIRSSLIFFVIHSFNTTFALILLTTRGGPYRSSELLTTYLYEQAFEFSYFGYGTSIGVLIFMVMFGITFLSLRITKREVYTY